MVEDRGLWELSEWECGGGMPFGGFLGEVWGGVSGFLDSELIFSMFVLLGMLDSSLFVSSFLVVGSLSFSTGFEIDFAPLVCPFLRGWDR